MEALNNAALLVLRVNRLKITPEKLKETLIEQYGIIAQLFDGYPDPVAAPLKGSTVVGKLCVSAFKEMILSTSFSS